MDTLFLPIILFISAIFGYTLSRLAYEELKELKIALEYAIIIFGAAALGVAFSFNIYYSIISIIIALSLMYFFKKYNHTHKIFLLVCGLVLPFASNIFIYSCIFMISAIFIISSKYNKKKNFFVNTSIYLYFFIPAMIIFLIQYLMGV
ncbi:MAG: hypothetical protein ACP5NV_05000 [Candidatus Woesearchaeota archaeon]